MKEFSLVYPSISQIVGVMQWWRGHNAMLERAQYHVGGAQCHAGGGTYDPISSMHHRMLEIFPDFVVAGAGWRHS